MNSQNSFFGMSRAELEQRVAKDPQPLELLEELARRYEDEGWRRDGQTLSEFVDNFLNYPLFVGAHASDYYRDALVETGPVAIPSLLEGLTELDFDIQFHALLGLEFLGPKAIACRSQILEILQKLISNNYDFELTTKKRFELLTQAFQTGISMQLVMDLTDLCQSIPNAPEADILVCLRVFQKLGRRFLSSLPVIRKCLLSSARSVRLLAIDCLTNFRKEQHLWREHAERLLNEKIEATTRINLTQLLESCNNPQSIDRFELLTNRIFQSRAAERATQALERLIEDFRSHPKLLETLQQCLVSVHPDCQSLALDTLIQIDQNPKKLTYDYLYDSPLCLRKVALKNLLRLCEGQSQEVWQLLPEFFASLNKVSGSDILQLQTRDEVFTLVCQWVLSQSDSKDHPEFLREEIVPRVIEFKSASHILQFPKLYELALNRLSNNVDQLFYHGEELSWQQTDTITRLALTSHLPTRYLEEFLKPHLLRWARNSDPEVIRGLRLRLHWAPRIRRAFVNKLVSGLAQDTEVTHQDLFAAMPQSFFHSGEIEIPDFDELQALDPVVDRQRLLTAADQQVEVSPDLAEKLTLSFATASHSSRRSILRALTRVSRPEHLYKLIDENYESASEDDQRQIIQATQAFLSSDPDDSKLLDLLEHAVTSPLWIVCFDAIRQLAQIAERNFRAYSLCVEALKHEHEIVRHAALEALLELQNKPELFESIFAALNKEQNSRNRSLAFDLLEKWRSISTEQHYLIFKFVLLDPDWTIRRRAYEMLELRPVIEEELFDALSQNLFTYSSYDNRHQTLALLSRVANRSDEFAVVLRRLLNESDPAIWNLALNYVKLPSLSGQALKAMRPYIRLMLHSRDPQHRRAALVYLRDDRTLARFLVSEVATMLKADAHDELSNQARRLLLKLCSKHPDTCRALIRLARQNKQMRWLVARILQQAAPTRCDKLLPLLVADLRGLVSAEQVNIAAAIFPRCKNAVQVLQELTDTLPVNEEITLIETLPYTPSFVVKKLVRCVTSNDKILAMRACKLLGRVRSATTEVLACLNAALSNNDERVKHAAMNAIRDLSRRRSSVSTRYSF